jgi:hypothetical protein
VHVQPNGNDCREKKQLIFFDFKPPASAFGKMFTQASELSLKKARTLNWRIAPGRGRDSGAQGFNKNTIKAFLDFPFPATTISPYFSSILL